MRPNQGGRWLRALLVLLLVVGAVTPVIVAGESVTPSPTPARLSAMISAAEGSALYARSVVGFALSHGLSVPSSQASLSRGDAELESAIADSQGGADLSAGIQSAEAAMSDFSSAASSASLAITGAGLVAAVDYTAVEQAIAEANASAVTVASVASAACASAGSSGTASGFNQACAQLEASTGEAEASLSQAAALAARSNGGGGGNASLSQAMAMVDAARSDLNSTQSELQAVASYGYAQRASAFVSSVIVPLSSLVNSTIAAEGSLNSTFSETERGFLAQAKEGPQSASSVTASASVLAGALAGVDPSWVGSNATAAEGIAAKVESDLSSLLALPGVYALQGVVSDIYSCNSAAGTYVSAASAASTKIMAFSQANVSSFSGYYAAVDQDAAAAQSAGTAYVSAYSKVTSDLSALLSVPGVSAIYDDLVSLHVSASVEGLNAALDQTTSAMATVQSDAAAYGAAVNSDSQSIVVPVSLLASAAAETAQAQAFLNATGSAALAQASTDLQSYALAAESFVSSANSSLQAAVGSFGTAQAALGSDASNLGAKASASSSAMSAAAAYLSSDLSSRASNAAMGKADVAAALSLFSSLDLSGGASAMAQAYLRFQAASETG
jgi:hypothetical protein